MSTSQTPDMTSAAIDWVLATTRLDAIRENVIRDGLTRDSVQAFLQTTGDLTNALCATSAARPDGPPAEATLADIAPLLSPGCICSMDCADDAESSCNEFGLWHVHAGQRCPVHPDAPRTLS